MAKHDDETTKSVGRRNFLKGAAAGAASALATGTAVAQQATPTATRSNVTRPTEADARADFVPPEPKPGAPVIETPGSDHMLDVLKLLNFDYVAVNPGSAFEGMHESIINHGGNKKPEIITVLHEEAGAAMSHGYAKAAGKPMMTLMHGTVGLLHASMGLFQAWADRVPVFATVAHAKNPNSTVNRPHSAQDMGSIVRDFVKMDDEPSDLEHFAESALRLYTIGRTPPMGPTLLVISSELQESAIPNPSKLRVPTSLTMPAPPQGDANAVREAASWLATAQRPLIRLGKLGRTPAGLGPRRRARGVAPGACRRRHVRVVARLPVVAQALRLGRPGLQARCDPRPRAQRHGRVRACNACFRRQDDQHLLRIPFPGPQHPRLRGLSRGGPRDRRRRRSDAAAADRGDPARVRQRRFACAASARHEPRGGAQGCPRAGARRRTLRLELEPRERAANDRRARAPGAERRLGDRFGPPVHRHMAAPAHESRQVLSLQRRLRRLRHRLRHAGVGRRRARAPRARPAADRDRGRRRLQLRRRRRALDAPHTARSRCCS